LGGAFTAAIQHPENAVGSILRLSALLSGSVFHLEGEGQRGVDAIGMARQVRLGPIFAHTLRCGVEHLQIGDWGRLRDCFPVLAGTIADARRRLGEGRGGARRSFGGGKSSSKGIGHFDLTGGLEHALRILVRRGAAVQTVEIVEGLRVFIELVGGYGRAL